MSKEKKGKKVNLDVRMESGRLRRETEKDVARNVMVSE